MAKISAGRLRAYSPVALLGLLVACSSADQSGETEGEQQQRLNAPNGVSDHVVSDAEAALLEEPEAPFNETMIAEISGGEVVVGRFEATDLSTAANSRLPPKGAQAKASAPTSKVSSDLRADGAKELNVLIQYDSDVRIPRMPRPVEDLPRDSAENELRIARTAQLVKWVQSKRQAAQDAHEADLVQRGAKVTERFWLIDAVAATIPASELAELAADPNVVAIDPEWGGEATSNTVSTGRGILNSDPYFNTAGMNTGYIGLLGTGIDWTHPVLSGRTSWVRDCVVGNLSNCGNTSLPLVLNPNDHGPHETYIANIMGGSTALGAQHRGVTGILLDSFRVADGPTSFSSTAIIRGYQAAIAGLDNVINASFDWNGAAVTNAANGAYDAGAIVVASAGNDGGTATNHIGNPGIGKKVLCVGAVDQTKTRWVSSATGPTSDGRTKPDIMALGTDVIAAAPNTRGMTVSGVWGTSIAAPFVSGGAGLLRRWMVAALGAGIETGHVYSMLLAAGENRVSPAYNNNIGAGNLALPTNATISSGKITVTNGQMVNVNVSVGAGSVVDAAIWWPEGTTHNDVDLTLKMPGGVWADQSTTTGNVWEKTAKFSATTGTWTLTVLGYSVTGTQTVYWSVIRR